MGEAARPERASLAPGLEISRIVTGLWQVADLERAGPLDPDEAAEALADYVAAGFDSFDMADHYGSAEVVAGRFLAGVSLFRPEARPVALTKWCPAPGAMTPEVVRAGVERSRQRLGVESIDLLQLHWWRFQHPGYLDAMAALDALQRAGLIRHLGVTNFDTDHLRVLVKQGFRVVSNQVSFSLLDEVAQALQDNPKINVEVQGHADSQGDDKFNLKLSNSRAASVRTYLIKKGVDSSRMTSKGYGENQPISDNRTEIGRSQNRRVEFVITSR